jgi:SnoaL-like domain
LRIIHPTVLAHVGSVGLESYLDPEIQWEPAASVPETQTYHGIDGVMEFFEAVLRDLRAGSSGAERLIDCGDPVLVFVRTEARARTTPLKTNEEWAHLVPV